VNLLRCANVLLLGAKLVFCSPQRCKSRRECVRAQGGRLRQWSPAARTWSPDKAPPALRPLRDASLTQRQKAVVGECELREIAGATQRRVACSSPPCEYSSAGSGPRAVLPAKEDVGALGSPAAEPQKSLREYHVVPRRFLRLLRTALGLLDVQRLKA
jgi:hypothetical protein